MRNINFLLVICLTFLFSNYTTPKQINTFNQKITKNNNDIFTAKLIAENYHVGDITLSLQDKNNVLVTYKMKDGWVLDKSNFFLGNSNSIPKKSNGCPNLKLFNNKTIHSPSVTEYTYTTPISVLKGIKCAAIVTKAVVTKGSLCLNAWSEGKNFTCNNGASYSEICDGNGNGEGNGNGSGNTN